MDPADLARQIVRLADDALLREQLGRAGHIAFQSRYAEHVLAEHMLRVLAELVPGFRSEDQMHWGAQPEFYGPRHRFREDYLIAAVRHYAPGQRVLDAACGAGTLARRLAATGSMVCGLDLSADFLRYLREHTRDQAHAPQLLRGDITQIPCGAEQFDAVVAGEVLEHLVNDGDALNECWRVLRPGGVCVISVPAEPSQWDWHDNWAGHVRRYRSDELRHRLTQAGFEIVRIHHFGFPFVRAFHQYIYLPRYRRILRNKQQALNTLSTKSWRQVFLIHIILLGFQIDHVFNALPFGIGLIAIVRKPQQREHPAQR